MPDGLFDAITAARSAILTGLAVAAICLPLAYCEGRKNGMIAIDAARALANTKALEMDARAGQVAAEDRVRDALTVERNEKDLINAIATTPDDQPDRVRVALGCQRLRQQGTGEADLPAICRH